MKVVEGFITLHALQNSSNLSIIFILELFIILVLLIIILVIIIVIVLVVIILILILIIIRIIVVVSVAIIIIMYRALQSQRPFVNLHIWGSGLHFATAVKRPRQQVSTEGISQ